MNRELFFEYLKRGVSPMHTVLFAEKRLQKAGFTELSQAGKWVLEQGRSYYVKLYDSAIAAFRLNEGLKMVDSFRIAAAHTDWPCLMLKPEAPILSQGYLKLNAEVYGGPILQTWLDRPLSAAGRVTVRGKDPFCPEVRFVDLEKPLFTIPNLAIHLNREVNKGVELNRQTDMLPLAGLLGEEGQAAFEGMLAEKAGCEPGDILYYELCLYNREEPVSLGLQEELVSSPRIDNISGCAACIEGLLESAGRRGGIDLAILFDNEEVGSRTKQGADSELLALLMRKICRALSWEEEDILNSAFKSCLLSVDVGHAIHPNHPEKHDPVNRPTLGSGLLIKTESGQRYATDGRMIGLIRGLCEKYEIPFRFFANRSDNPGGTTLGSMASAGNAMAAADIGIPLLAMHSARETMAYSDQEALCSLISRFYGENV